jgi:hypothetical protein
MFNININWLKIIKENLPFDSQNSYTIDLIKMLISPFNKIYQEFLVQYQVYVYKIRFNGQVQYLQRILNDKFDPVNGDIYIMNGAIGTPKYLYRNSESKPPFYLYKKWKVGATYYTGNFALDENKAYKALSNNVGIKPSLNPSDWQFVRDVTYLRRKTEFYISFDFIVMVPSTLTFNLVAMKAIIDYYRLAGKRYKIQLY